MSELREDVLDTARLMAERLLKGRTGHGGGECTYRQMRKEDLIAFAYSAILAHESRGYCVQRAMKGKA